MNSLTKERYRRYTIIVLSKMPLLLLHGVGFLLGALSFLLRRRSRQQSIAFARQANIPHPVWNVFLSYADFGRSALEAPWIWINSPEKVLSKIHLTINPALQKMLEEATTPAIFVGIHQGCSEAAIVLLAERYRAMPLYQRQKNPWVLALRAMQHPRHQTVFLSMDTMGIRAILRRLQSGGCIGMAIDQTPYQGSGEWLPFFGKNAYTMTLAPKLSQMEGVKTIRTQHLRRWGGFSVSLSLLEYLPENLTERGAAMNKMVEETIRLAPHQYRWAYDRYRVREKS